MNRSLKKLRDIKDERALAGKFVEAADICHDIGKQLQDNEKFEIALDYYLEELSLRQKSDDQLQVGIVHRWIAECLESLDRLDEAIDHVKQFIEASSNANDKIEQQRAYATLGKIYFTKAVVDESQDTFERSEVAFLRAHRFAQELEKLNALLPEEIAVMKGRLLLNLSNLKQEQGCREEAVKYLERAILLLDKFKLNDELFSCYSSLVDLSISMQNNVSAVQASQRLLELSKKSKQHSSLCQAYHQRGRALIAVGDFKGARSFQKQAFFLRKHVSEDEQLTIRKYCKLVTRIVEHKRQFSEAITPSAKIAHCEKIGDALASLEQYDLAVRNYLEAPLPPEGDADLRNRYAAILSSVALCYEDMNQPERAIEFYRKELLFRDEDDVSERCSTYLSIARCMESAASSSSNRQELEGTLLQARECSTRLNDREKMASCYRRLIEFYGKVGMDLEETKAKEEAKFLGIDDLVSNESEDQSSVGDDKSSGDDSINLDELSGVSDDESGVVTSGRRRNKGAGVKVDSEGNTPLHLAAIRGNVDRVRELLRMGHDVHAVDNCGWTPLHEAATNGHLEVVELLLEAGADIHRRGDEKALDGGLTPLLSAADAGHPAIMGVLLDAGADPEAVNNEGYSALDLLEEYHVRDGKACSDEEKSAIVCMKRRLHKLAPNSRKKRRFVDVDTNGDAGCCEGESGKEESGEGEGEQQFKVKDNWLEMDVVEKPNRRVVSHPLVGTTTFQSSSNISSSGSSRHVTKKRPRSDALHGGAFKSNKYRRKEGSVAKDVLETDRDSKRVTCTISDDDDESMDEFRPLSSFVEREKTVDTTTEKQTESVVKTNAQSTSSTTQSSSIIPKALRVRIMDKLILVPLPSDCVTKTVQWLADAVSDRYFILEGYKPVVSLSMNDAMLVPSDSLACILSLGSDITADVQRFDVLPLLERYERLTNEKIASKHLERVLETAQQSGCLSLEYCRVNAALLQAIKYQLTLTRISLVFVHVDISPLGSSLATLTNLHHLIIEGCSVNANDLSRMAEQLREVKLPSLQTLSLSFNILSNAACPSLVVLAGVFVNVRSIKVAACSFTGADIVGAIQRFTYLRELDISDNNLDTVGVEALLNTCKQLNLIKLDISNCIKLRSKDVLHRFCEVASLKHLAAESCSVTAKDLEDLPKRFDKLELSLGGNVDVSRDVVSAVNSGVYSIVGVNY